MAVIEDEINEVQQATTEHGETLKALQGDEHLTKVTVFSNFNQAQAYATLWAIADENDILFLKRWLKKIADTSISVGGKGMENVVEVSKYKGSNSPGWTERIIDKMSGR